MQNKRLMALPLLALAVAACGSGSSGSQSTQSEPAASPLATSSIAAAPAAASAAASPSAAAAEVINGKISSSANGRVTLDSGRSFGIQSATVRRAVVIRGSDLSAGQYVAVTAKRQPDNTLIASIVNVFPPSLGQVAPGQRPLPEGNLMTNATIDQVEGNTFTVTFPGGGARVALAPDAKITRTDDATSADLTPGATVSAQLVDDQARTITIQPAA